MHKIVIMAAGEGFRWHNYLGKPKQLVEIDGEPLIKRTIRQLRARGLTDITVTVKLLGQYGDLGVPEHITSPNQLPIDRVWGARQFAPCIYLYGDVFYSDVALDIILGSEQPHWFFGKAIGNEVKNHREIYAIKADAFVIEKAGELRKLRQEGKVRYCLGQHLLIHCLGIPYSRNSKQHIATPAQLAPLFTEIADETTDFDTPSDYLRWINAMRKQPMGQVTPKRQFSPMRQPIRRAPVILKKPRYKAPPGWGRDKAIRTFYTIAQLVDDVKTSLLVKVPADIDLVVAIPRDGIMIAYLISIFRNIPYTDLTSLCAGVMPKPGIKHRNTENFARSYNHLLLVDDICASGNAMRDAVKELTVARAAGRNNLLANIKTVKTCALYVTEPAAKISQGLLDIWGCDLVGPRHYEWTHCDAVHLPNTMMDIDGILCDECPPPLAQEDDVNAEAPGYLAWLQTVPLKVRPQHIGCLITWRREKYRAETEAWLQRNGITYLNLIMADRPKYAGPAQYKASYYGASQMRLLIESSRRQAEEIAKITGKPVVCFTTNEAWNVND
jgi:orotate phosphoribosyltransferase